MHPEQPAQQSNQPSSSSPAAEGTPSDTEKGSVAKGLWFNPTGEYGPHWRPAWYQQALAIEAGSQEPTIEPQLIPAAEQSRPHPATAEPIGELQAPGEYASVGPRPELTGEEHHLDRLEQQRRRRLTIAGVVGVTAVAATATYYFLGDTITAFIENHFH